MKILVIEDEPKLNKGLVLGLQQRGYAVDAAYDGVEGEAMARIHGYDCVVLDVMLPGRDGFTVCRNLRSFGLATPIIFLTARDLTEDKIAGLDLGADDYLVKPFAFDELAARIRTVLRRPPTVTTDILTLDDLQLNTRTQIVTAHNKKVPLTLREYSLLEYLLRNQPSIVTREDILTHVWDQFYDSFSNVVDVHLKNIRKKLPAKYAKRITTIRGKGYRIA